MAAKSNYLKLTLPKAKCSYPKIYRPDTPEYGGDYKVTLTYGLEEAKPIVAKIKAFAAEVYAPAVLKDKGFRWPWKTSEDKTEVSFLLRSKNKPGVFDAKGHPVEQELRIGGGTTMKANVSFAKTGDKAPKPGIKVYLNAVQIINLVEWQKAAVFTDASDEAEGESFVAGDADFADEGTASLEDGVLGTEATADDEDPLSII